MVRTFIFGSAFMVLLALQPGIPLAQAVSVAQQEDDKRPDDAAADSGTPGQGSGGRSQPQTCEIRTMPVAKNVCVSKTAVMEVCTGAPPEFRRCM